MGIHPACPPSSVRVAAERAALKLCSARLGSREMSAGEELGELATGPPPGMGGTGDSSKIKDTIDLTHEDCAFVCGRSGTTKQKLARVSGASLDLSQRDLKIYIEGTREQVDKARDYIGFVLAQRVGDVDIDTENTTRTDLSVVVVPEECVAYIMGKGVRDYSSPSSPSPHDVCAR